MAIANSLNTGAKITLDGNVDFSGNFTFAATLTGNTSVTFPTSGTLATSAGASIPGVVQGDLLYGSGVNALSALAKDTNATRYLSNTGTNNNPAWTQVDLSNGVSGVLPLSSGGTNKALTADNGGIIYSDADSFEVLAATATAGKVLQSGSNAAPSWSTPTYPSASGSAGTILRADGTNNLYSTFTIPNTFAQGDLIYGSASNVLSALAKDTNSTRYLSNQGASNSPSWNQITLTNGVTGILPPANGGTGVANASNITVGGAVTFSGAFGFTGTVTNTTSVTFPTSGILVNVFDVRRTMDFRLSLVSGDPVATGTAGNIATIYMVPYIGNSIALYTGSVWQIFQTAEISIAVPSGVTNRPYDIFAYNNAGTVTLETVTWTNFSTRATALTTQDNIYVKSGDATRRYIGTASTVASGQSTDAPTNRSVWNYYNRIAKQLRYISADATWTYALTTIRQANANASNLVGVTIGVQEDIIAANLHTMASGSTTIASIALTVDSTSSTATSTMVSGVSCISGDRTPMSAFFMGYVGVGKHNLIWVEASDGTTTFRGTDDVAGSGINVALGINGWVLC